MAVDEIENLVVLLRETDPGEAKPQALADLLGEVEAFVRRFVALTDEQAIGIALWIAHTHAIEASDCTPYVAITSPTKRAGKTRLLEVVEQLVRDPIRASNVSDAALFRLLSERPRTLLLDEVDAIFSPRSTRDDLRGLLNASSRRGAKIPRCVGEGVKMRIVEFEAYGPKALAGIGRLPDTIADRALPVRVQRRTSEEAVERFRFREAQALADPLRAALAEACEALLPELAAHRPDLPDDLDDRAQDAFEPLLALADLAGGDWPERARRALVLLRAGDEADDEGLGVRLLADVRQAFAAEGVDRLATSRLLELLLADEEAPWGDYRGRPLTPRGLGRLLEPFGVRSRTIRLPDGRTPKGYFADSFADSFARYLPQSAFLSATSATTARVSQKPAIFDPPQTRLVADTKSASNPHEQRDVADVADKNPERGKGRAGGAVSVVSEGDTRGRPPALGDAGFEGYIARVYAEGHITERERDGRVALHRALRRVRISREQGEEPSAGLRAELATALELAREARA